MSYDRNEWFWKIIDTVSGFFLCIAFRLIGRQPSEKSVISWRQFCRFCVVGVSNVIVSYVINIVVLVLLRRFEYSYDYVIGNTTAFLLSVFWSYYWNSRFVFKEEECRRNKWRTLLKTYMAYGFCGIILNNVLSTIWIKILHVSKYISPLINLLFTVPINYTINKYWAYKSRETPID